MGGYVHHAWRGVGACATQGLTTNPWYPRALRPLLEQGAEASSALQRVISADSGAARRQCLVMDANGRAAVHSGADNLPCVASRLATGVAVAGNMLAGDRVVHALFESFLRANCDNSEAVLNGREAPNYRDNYETGLPESLVTSLASALDAGGDVRGARSAALRIESFASAPIDLRVDWSEGDLISQLQGLVQRVRAPEFAEFLASLPAR
ncbi:hypothetical protein BJB45_00600 [Halomonas huangheensis]|uniref:DUF1028 domain-containing protein n=1 Tax=Halomonas huangheensis TaxID=1178482 RepID=W1N3W0_9GAMM|nr:hypothetical protein BJB45_00600 [Halomonas huangheensis]